MIKKNKNIFRVSNSIFMKIIKKLSINVIQ